MKDAVLAAQHVGTASGDVEETIVIAVDDHGQALKALYLDLYRPSMVGTDGIPMGKVWTQTAADEAATGLCQSDPGLDTVHIHYKASYLPSLKPNDNINDGIDITAAVDLDYSGSKSYEGSLDKVCHSPQGVHAKIDDLSPPSPRPPSPNPAAAGTPHSGNQNQGGGRGGRGQ
jgi:hypothetical protein